MRDETELEAVRRARDSILANISHEFRTPLAAQQASIELLRDGLADMPRDKLEELVDSLQRGTLRLTRLIDNLLESVRIESGQLGIRRQPVELAQVVEDAQELIAGLLAAAPPTAAGGHPRRPAAGTGRPAAARAGRHQPARQRQQVRPRALRDHRGASRAGDGVSLWVEDEDRACPTWTGLDLRALLSLGRPGARAPRPRAPGCGIAKSIVDRHGGRIGVERTAAGRTRFTVTSRCWRGHVKILIVDDDADLLSWSPSRSPRRATRS